MGKKIAIIGGGNGGQAFAGWLSLKGHETTIFDVFQPTVDKLNELGGVQINGNSDYTGFGKIKFASTDIGKVMDGAEIVMVVLPSIYHKDMAKKMAPYLKDGQVVVLSPIASLGPVEFQNTLNECGCTAKIVLMGCSTLLFACRAVEIGRVEVAGQKASYAASGYPCSHNEMLKELFKDIIPQFNFTDDILRVSLDNLNAMMHPTPTILYTGKIEHQDDFQYYLDMTPSIGAVLDALDKERMALGEAYGLKLRTLTEEYHTVYPTCHGDNMYETITSCTDAYTGIKGQKTMRTRYLLEDIPYSLVALQAMGLIAGVPTPLIDGIIAIAYAMIPEMDEGRTVKNLGLEGVSKEDFIKMCRG